MDHAPGRSYFARDASPASRDSKKLSRGSLQHPRDGFLTPGTVRNLPGPASPAPGAVKILPGRDFYFSGSHSSVRNDDTGNPSVLNRSPTIKSLNA